MPKRDDFPPMEDVFSPEVLEQLQIALDEIGEIVPWYDDEVESWVFEHPLYPESYGGDDEEEVIHGYPYYLAQIIDHRMKGDLSPIVEKRWKGRAGPPPPTRHGG